MVENGQQPEMVKMTVMLGGPHPLNPAHTSLDIILKHLASHLSPPGSPPKALPDPLFARIRHHVNCIPTLGVGHLDRMDELRAALGVGGKTGSGRQGNGGSTGGNIWGGRMEVIGAGVGGVSVGDCVEAGRGVGVGWS
jgi:oxygen-dependent protoporphyrinogen oxidase